MSKAGKWLDRGLSKLIGVAELPEGMQAADATRPPLGPPQQHRRASSQPGSPKVVLPSLQTCTPLPAVAPAMANIQIQMALHLKDALAWTASRSSACNSEQNVFMS